MTRRWLLVDAAGRSRAFPTVRDAALAHRRAGRPPGVRLMRRADAGPVPPAPLDRRTWDRIVYPALYHYDNPDDGDGKATA